MQNNMDLKSLDLKQEPPVKEPERQYYYIAKCRELVGQKAKTLGRSLTYHVTTFGCQMNAVHGI